MSSNLGTIYLWWTSVISSLMIICFFLCIWILQERIIILSSMLAFDQIHRPDILLIAFSPFKYRHYAWNFFCFWVYRLKILSAASFISCAHSFRTLGWRWSKYCIFSFQFLFSAAQFVLYFNECKLVCFFFTFGQILKLCSQNHRMFEIEKDLWGSSGLPCSSRVM